MTIALDHAVTTDSGVSPTTEKRSRSAPLRSTICEGGLNFSIFPVPQPAWSCCSSDREDDPRAENVIPIDPVPTGLIATGARFVLRGRRVQT